MSADANHPEASFTLFNDLPIELRRLIWEQALPEDAPEVCIPWPLEENLGEWDPGTDVSSTFTAKRADYLDPLLVDTGFPVLMHVCHEAREIALSRTRLRHSPLAGCPVPFRAFRPDLDTLYVSVCRPSTLLAPRWGLYPSGTRHLALDLHSAKDGSFLWVLVGNPRLDVHSISFVVPARKAILDAAARFRPPARRCRLRPVEQPADGSHSHIVCVDRGYDRRMTGLARYVDEVRDHVSDEFRWALEDLGQLVPPRDAEWSRNWDAAESAFVDVSFQAKMFEEFRGGAWVPSSGHAFRFENQVLVSQVPAGILRNYRVSEAEDWTPLRDPERFRVNDIQQDEVQFGDW
ncbi:hypothetical protein GGR54DRAFT_93222 [Hypoxylon sp. NC1633]|nr:hypothetical protein GGR54DRAFT_93222 [Hypoxylon sp. NC1633]